MTTQVVQSELRKPAIVAEGAGGEEIQLASVWQRLKTGQIVAVAAFFTEERCYVVFATPSAHEPHRPLAPRECAVLEALLRGQYPKSVAADFGLSLSTISMVAKLGLQHLGFEFTPSRFHPLLAMAVRTETDVQESARGREATFLHAGEVFRVVSAVRPDDRLGPVLPPAEYAVLRGLVEGKNYVEIARGRGTSIRTVANQMAAAFRRLGVSGRCSVIHLLTTPQTANP